MAHNPELMRFDKMINPQLFELPQKVLDRHKKDFSNTSILVDEKLEGYFDEKEPYNLFSIFFAAKEKIAAIWSISIENDCTLWAIKTY